MVLIIFVELSSGSPQRGKEESRSYWGSTNSVHGYPGKYPNLLWTIGNLIMISDGTLLVLTCLYYFPF